MRTSILLVLLAFCSFRAVAQDVLTKRNGEEINVKVTEVTPSEVKYRRTDNPDGPLISVWKSDVFMIRYANGTKEVLNAAPVTSAAGASASATVSPPSTAGMGGVTVPGDEVGTFESIHLGGPRIGFTVLTSGVLDRARELPGASDLNPLLTQFGWQFETRLFRMPNGVSAVAEVIPLVGGVEQGKFIPSVSGLLGVRGPKGFEFGLGPNVTPLGSNIVLAVGTSFRSNGINFPVNLAVVPGNGGARISLLFGFNSRKN